MTVPPLSPAAISEAMATLSSRQPGLAEAFGAGWEAAAGVWAAGQWAPPTEPAFEPAFRRALVDELAGRAELDRGGADALVAAVERGGAVLTPHHVCPTPGPTFGAIDHLSCLGHDGPILVLAWSGVPMSNSAASGALCFSQTPLEALLEPGPELKRQRQAAKDRARDGITEQRLTLVPSSMRDVLLYECPVPERLHDMFASATPALRELLPEPTPHETYAGWALRAGEAVERRAFGRADLVYVDLNQVARRYLLEVLREPEHPTTRFLASATPVPGLSFFYGRRPGKREKVATYDSVVDGVLDGLESGAICPGLVPVFGALRMLSRIRLLGGFRQIGYLETIAEAWRAAGLEHAEVGVSGRLLTGRLAVDGVPVHPLDIALGTVPRDALPGPSAPMARFWTPLLPRVQQLS